MNKGPEIYLTKKMNKCYNKTRKGEKGMIKKTLTFLVVLAILGLLGTSVVFNIVKNGINAGLNLTQQIYQSRIK